ncbi:MAG TPA: transglycosylase domain-containing protein [Thermoleophilaceae bacterium]|nr:transglycosylase domain-containing protein [Thermoleophilaceae bacterium]
MTYRQRRQRRRRATHRAKPLFVALTVLGAIAGIAATSVAGYVIAVAASAPALDELKPNDKGESSVIYAADGTRLGYVQSDEIRTPIGWDELPAHLREATVAIEDENFYKHAGVDYGAIVRAGIKNLESGKSLQGGSTITQQLVRALYIDDPERNIQRKIREAKLASELEQERSKKWILQNYLNDVPYGTVGGRTAIGVEAAAETFFDKHARNLTLPEAATLAGLPQAPSQYNPFHNPRAALERRNEVLGQMLDNGYITPAEHSEAVSTPLDVEQGTRYTRRREPYFFDYVQEQLIERYGVGVYRRGGLKVHTTINPKMQDVARDAINAYYGDPAGPSSAIVSIDPSNGEIKAMASSGTYQDRRFNLAAQAHRQPGSAFKTMVLTAAVLEGVDPDATSYTSTSPITIDVPGSVPWTVKTFGGAGAGTMSLTRATLSSDNSVYAQLIMDVGPDSVCKTARLLGIRTKLDCNPAEGLGGLRLGVTPLEMASAYATLAAGGVRHRPTAIKRVVFPDGKSENLSNGDGKRVMTDGQAYEVTQILEMNVTSGTGTAAGYGCPAAGKTGTTDEAKDAWFVGYTPKLSTSVWVGYPDANIAMPGAQGGTTAAPVWHAFMSPAAGDDCSDFPEPEEPFESTPFYGKYASGGGSTSSYDDYSYSSGDSYTESYDSGGGTGDESSGAYQAPATEAPAPAPTPAPTPGGAPAPAGGGVQTP